MNPGEINNKNINKVIKVRMRKFIKRIIYYFVKNNRYYKSLISKYNPTLEEILSGLIHFSDLRLVIDVGANSGQTIEQMLDLNKNVNIHSFEPTPDLYIQLVNKYKYKNNITIQNFALGIENGEVEFNISDFSPTNSILKPNLERYREYENNLFNILNQTKKVIIKQQKFDDYYSILLKEKIIDIFKTDTQGYDFYVLQGAASSLKNIKMVIVELQFLEFYNNSPNFSKVINSLYEHDFFLYSIFDVNKKNNQWIECNALFLNKNYQFLR